MKCPTITDERIAVLARVIASDVRDGVTATTYEVTDHDRARLRQRLGVDIDDAWKIRPQVREMEALVRYYLANPPPEPVPAPLESDTRTVAERRGFWL